ncbi:glycosyltransferase family A protein [Mesobacillus selenatarsenatis]|uniref:Glycosyltransferase n=1 Tax=Mesobacillus selenatarsenatis (strain DSM 18680 / JCM 14380 / FERM P-15431 / SF-1) TaxID=1321606 RepID=A0A0A8WWJ6_MESS1|nr:glycosyltransferase family 2 protein [Mesobacillus selenatarsenatis]GAM12020.1 glycosyltransferase [Mesobacillus selenatarsenatis SF-1]
MISVIVPTLGTRQIELIRLFDSLENQSNGDFEVILVSQDNEEKIKNLLSNYNFSHKHIHINKKGLSHARNVGLNYISGDIVTFSDDDCWYLNDSFEKVHSYLKNSSAGIICFQMFDPDKNEYLKNYPDEVQPTVSKRGLWSKSSIEIFIDLKKVKKEHLRFDEEFGLGAKYPSGEENILLFDLYSLGYQIAYEPELIVYHEKKDIVTRLNTKTVLGKGPMFKRMYNTPVSLALITLFFFKKYNLIQGENKAKLLISSLNKTIRYNKN